MTTWLLKYRWPVWILIAATVAAAAVHAFRLKLDTDVVSLLSPDDPVLVDFLDAESALPTSNLFFEVVPAADGDALDTTAADLMRLDDVAFAVARPPNDRERLLVGQFAPRTFDLEVIREVLGRVRAVLDARHPHYGLTGNLVVLLEGTDWLTGDLQRAGLIAMVLLAVFFTVFYRDGVLALLAVVPVAVGLAWALGMWSLGGGRLTILAAAVPTFLLGMGVDYTIHIVTAVREELDGATDRRAAIIAGSRRVLRPITVGALTTAAAFGSLIAARTPGLVHMGWVGMLATVCIFAAAALTIPPILLVLPNRWLRPRRSMVDRLMPGLARFVPRRRWIVLGATLVFAVAAGFLLRRLRLETDYTRFENLNRPARKLQDRLMRDWGISATLMVLIFDAPDQAQAVATEFRAHRPDYPSIMRVGLPATVSLSLTDVLPLPDGRSATFLHPAENAYSIHAYERLRAGMASLLAAAGAKPAVVTGGPVVNKRLSDLYRHDLAATFVVCVGVLLVCLAVGLLSIRLAALALVPLACGLLLAGGVLVLTGQNLALAGAAVAPLILGIGVDDGVHVIIRWRQSRGDLATVLRGTGRAVFATTVTTVCAFVAFIGTRTPALVQMGWLIAVGLTGCLIASLVVLPAVGWFGRRNADR